MATIIDGKDTVKFVDQEQIDQAAASEASQLPEDPKKTQESEPEDQSAAFNPETGEINWDCPCLGGMAQGPCGDEFKAAFSCFVYSEAEPKGLDCVEKFKGMQDCFRLHPDVYGDEIDDDEDDDAVLEETEVAVKEEPKEEESLQEEQESAKEEEHVTASSPFEEESSISNSFSSWVSSWL